MLPSVPSAVGESWIFSYVRVYFFYLGRVVYSVLHKIRTLKEMCSDGHMKNKKGRSFGIEISISLNFECYSGGGKKVFSWAECDTWIINTNSWKQGEELLKFLPHAKGHNLYVYLDKYLYVLNSWYRISQNSAVKWTGDTGKIMASCYYLILSNWSLTSYNLFK